jgi:hypothetical protein
LDARRLLPYIVGLLILAFALGSLPRSQPGGSLLFRSYWLLYLIYLVPIAVLGITIALAVVVALNWRDISAAIGFQRARNRKQRKRGSRWSSLISVAFWVLAIGVLLFKKGSIFNPNLSNNSTITQIIGGNSTVQDSLQLGGVIPVFSSLIDSSWFTLAFMGLVVIGGLVLVESYRVSIKETREINAQLLRTIRVQSLRAVNEAMRLVGDRSRDPRTRIIACFQCLMETASRLGTPLSPDLTARELESAIRSRFELEGTASNDLTQLFEEARYSLHEIEDDDAETAHGYLEDIARELNVELGC